MMATPNAAKRKLSVWSSIAVAVALALGYGGAQLQRPAQPTRARQEQLKAEYNQLAVWIPLDEGMWEYRPARRGAHGQFFLDDPMLLLVSGPAGDGLAMPVQIDGEGKVLGIAEVRSVRALGAGHWTFLRAPKNDDPAIPGA